MNPAYDKILNLLVEAEQEPPARRTTPSGAPMQKQHKTFKRYGGTIKGFSLPRTVASLREPWNPDQNTNLMAKELDKIKPGYSIKSDPWFAKKLKQQQQADSKKYNQTDPPADNYIPPPLKRQDPKKEPLYKRILGAFMKKFGRAKDE